MIGGNNYCVASPGSKCVGHDCKGMYCTVKELENNTINSRVLACSSNPRVPTAPQLRSCFAFVNYARTALYF